MQIEKQMLVVYIRNKQNTASTEYNNIEVNKKIR